MEVNTCMRKRELRLVVTFHTTAEAIAWEKLCKKESLPGRLIPVPRQISSGCGLSWSMPADWKERMETLAGSRNILFNEMGLYTI